MFISKENYKSQMGQSHLDELSRMMEEDYKKTVKAFSSSKSKELSRHS